MYEACVIEDNPLVRTVLDSVLKENGFEVSAFCDIRDRCPGFPKSCRSGCQRTAPCDRLLILFNCERDKSGIEFLKFIRQNECPCSHSFKVLYTCEEIKTSDIAELTDLHVQLVEKENPAIDMLPLIEKYKSWFHNQKVRIDKA